MNPVSYKFFIPGAAAAANIQVNYYGSIFYNSDADKTIVFQQKNVFNMTTYQQTFEAKMAYSSDLDNWSILNVPSGYGLTSGIYYTNSDTIRYVARSSAASAVNMTDGAFTLSFQSSTDLVNWTPFSVSSIKLTPEGMQVLNYAKVAQYQSIAAANAQINYFAEVGNDKMMKYSVTSTNGTILATSAVVSHDNGTTWNHMTNFETVCDSFPSTTINYGHYYDKISYGFGNSIGIVQMEDTNEPYIVWNGSRAALGNLNTRYQSPMIENSSAPGAMYHSYYGASSPSTNAIDYNPVSYLKTGVKETVVDSYGRLIITTDGWATKTLIDTVYSDAIAKDAGLVQFIGGTNDNQFMLFCTGATVTTTDGWSTWSWNTDVRTKLQSAIPGWQSSKVSHAFSAGTQVDDNVFVFGIGYSRACYSTNNGVTWTLINTNSQTAQQFFKAPNTSEIYMKSAGAVSLVRNSAGTWLTTVSSALTSSMISSTVFAFYNQADNAWYFYYGNKGGYKLNANANGTIPNGTPTYVSLPNFQQTSYSAFQTTPYIKIMSLGNGIYSCAHQKHNTIELIDTVNKTSIFKTMSAFANRGNPLSQHQIGGGFTANVVVGNMTNVRVFGDFWSSAYSTDGCVTFTHDTSFHALVGITNLPTATFEYTFVGSLPNTINAATYGSGYPSDAVITISPPNEPDGIQAEVGLPQISGGSIYNIRLKNIGRGYTQPATITITSSTGSGATFAPVKPIKHIEYVKINDPQNILHNPYRYTTYSALAPNAGARITTDQNGYVTVGTGDVYSLLSLYAFGGSMFSTANNYGYISNINNSPTTDLSKLIQIEYSNATQPGSYGIVYNPFVSQGAGSQLQPRVCIYDASNNDRVYYKKYKDFFTNLPAHSFIHPAPRSNMGAISIVDVAGMGCDPYLIISIISSLEGANVYNSDKTWLVGLALTDNIGTTDIRVTYQYWTATYDNVADTMTLRDKVFEQVDTVAAANIATDQQANQLPVLTFGVGTAKCSPGTLGTTWMFGTYQRDSMTNTFTVKVYMTEDSGQTFAEVTTLPIQGMPVWNDNEQEWMLYDATNRKFYHSADLVTWDMVNSPTGI